MLSTRQMEMIKQNLSYVGCFNGVHEPTLQSMEKKPPPHMQIMKKRDIAEKIARARSQLYREAIANFIQAETGDPQVQAEERRLVAQLEDHADRWHRIARSRPVK